MKRALFGVMLAVLLVGLSGRAFATSTDELQIMSGAQSVTITAAGVCSGTGTACSSFTGNSTLATGTMNGWKVSVIADSNSPGLTPNGIDLSSLTASCLVAGCTGANDLKVLFSDRNFSTPIPAGGFVTTYSDTQGGAGTTSESAYFDNTNTIFLTTNLIGTVGPFVGSNHGSALGGLVAAVPNYSLTLDQTFSAAGPTSFSVDGNITAVPEPASLTLVGTGLIGLAGLLRRKLLRA